MLSEIAGRHEKARRFLTEKDFTAFVVSSAENIQYLTGIQEPSIHTCGVAIISRETPCKLAVMWLDENVAKNQTGIEVRTYTPYNQIDIVADILNELGAINGRIGMDSRAITVLENSLRKKQRNIELVNANNVIEELRWIKSNREIDLIQKACEIADKGMKTAAEVLKPGISELEAAALIEKEMISAGSDELKHRTVVASGPRICLTHPFATHKKIAKGACYNRFRCSL